MGGTGPFPVAIAPRRGSRRRGVRVFSLVAAARARLRLPPLGRIDGGDELRRETQLVLRGTREPLAAVRVAMQSLADSNLGARQWIDGTGSVFGIDAL